MAAAAEVGTGVNKRWLAGFASVCLLLFAVSARAATYYITVAGLGGEADYEQRFEGQANHHNQPSHNGVRMVTELPNIGP